MADSDARNREPQDGRRVLRGYRQDGKRFIPPMLDIANTQESHWLDDRLPELIWIALLIHRLGVRQGIAVATSIAKAAATCAQDSERGFAAASDYTSLTDDEKTSTRAALTAEGVLVRACLSLAALINHYEEFPLAFLAEQDTLLGDDQESTLSDLKKTIGATRDRGESAGLFVQATAVYILLVNKKLNVPPGLGFENLDAILDYPLTDESKKLAALVRSTSLTLLSFRPAFGLGRVVLANRSHSPGL